MFNTQLKKLSHFLLPTTCVLCGARAGRDIDLCAPCEQDLPWLTTGACPRCAMPLRSATNECGHCLQQALPFNNMLTLFYYRPPLDHLIAGFKFQQQLVYGRVLSELLLQRVQDWYRDKPLPDCIIPVPLHPQRLRERGYNQALELARPIAKELKIKLDVKSCQRVKATLAQSNLPAADRVSNIKHAFVIAADLRTKHIALLDDVVTTGCTITELSCELQAVGVKQIDVWCCARTVPEGY